MSSALAQMPCGSKGERAAARVVTQHDECYPFCLRPSPTSPKEGERGKEISPIVTSQQQQRPRDGRTDGIGPRALSAMEMKNGSTKRKCLHYLFPLDKDS